MKTLNQHYDIWLKTYSRLEDLISTILVKTFRSADKWLDEKKENTDHLANQETVDAQVFEDAIDRLAYNTAINRRFEHYYDLTITYLKSYLKEKYAVRSLAPNKVFQVCCDQQLISQAERGELTKIAQYAKSIRKPYNSEGDYAFSDEILIYTVTLKDIVEKLKPNTTCSLKSLVHPLEQHKLSN
ncbi:hypothetical protein H0X48_05985 [Candidatus Dependentiae bacterium]|nr:hypothetical protein [Candidatus Dependentiae bacterium]